MHHPLVVAILLQQFFAEPEERRVRHAVVFEDDRLFDLFEHPLKTGRRTDADAEVPIGIILQNLAVPVDAVDDHACRLAPLRLTSSIRTGTIGNHEQALGASGGNSVDDALGDVGPVEDEKRNIDTHVTALSVVRRDVTQDRRR